MVLEATMPEIVRAFEAGRLPRDEYWARMQRFHLAFRDYHNLIQGEQLAGIEITAGELRVVLQNGLKVVWCPEDLRTAPSVLVNHGAYEAAELAILERLAMHCHTVLDIGANLGWYSLHLARLLGPRNGKVYAFEPVPRTCQQLVRNITLNGLGDVVMPFNLALGEKEGQATFYLPRFTGSVAGSQRLLFPEDANEQVECRLVRLDDLLQVEGVGKVDLIKCDVEGSELFALRGGLATLAAHRPVIMLEMLRKWSKAFGYHPNDIIDLLAGLGYRCWAQEPDGLRPFARMDDQSTQTNFFFFHAGTHEAMVASLRRTAARAP